MRCTDMGSLVSVECAQLGLSEGMVEQGPLVQRHSLLFLEEDCCFLLLGELLVSQSPAQICSGWIQVLES